MTRSERQDAHLTNDGNHYRLNIVKVDLFSTRLRKLYGMTFNRRVVIKTSWCNLPLAN